MLPKIFVINIYFFNNLYLNMIHFFLILNNTKKLQLYRNLFQAKTIKTYTHNRFLNKASVTFNGCL